VVAALKTGDDAFKSGQEVDTRAQDAEAHGKADEAKALHQEARAHFEEARSNYEKLLALRPDLGKAIQMQIARCYKMLGNIPTELEHLQAAADLNPGEADIRTLMAMEALDGGLMDKATEFLKAMDESSVKSPDVFFNIGVSFLNKGHQPEAVTYFTKAVTLDPNYVDGYFQRGLTYLGMQKLAESKADFQKVMTLAPGSPQAETAKKALATLK
jgi:tetratricopeptide (TPR) repeat protein